MSNEIVTLAAKAIVIAGALLFYIVVIPYLKGKIGADKLAKIEEYTELFVRAAEQLFAVEEFALKKEYVLKNINKAIEDLGIEMSLEEIDALIEGTVNLVKRG